MDGQRRATENIRRVGREALRLLAANDGISLAEVARVSKQSLETAKRALEWLRDQGADVVYEPKLRGWTLRTKGFSLPFADPTVEDLVAALTAPGLLSELGLETAATRARSLFDELAQRTAGGRASALRPNSLRVTQTTSVVRRPELMLVLLRAARRSVVRVQTVSAWTRAESTHELEPWQVWIHDGVPYVRGFSRKRGAPRTFGLANIRSVEVIRGEKPSARVPADPWAGEDPRSGVDADRPSHAVLRFAGPVARWVASMRWHPEQADRWIVPDEELERRVPYRSCREMARRIVAVGDGLLSVEPAALRDEVRKISAKVAEATG